MGYPSRLPLAKRRNMLEQRKLPPSVSKYALQRGLEGIGNIGIKLL